MSSSKPLTAIVERLIERRKSGDLPQPPKRKAKPKQLCIMCKKRQQPKDGGFLCDKCRKLADASIPKNRTLH